MMLTPPQQHTAKRITLPDSRLDMLMVDDGASEYQAQWRFAGSSTDHTCQPPAYAAPLDQLGVVWIQSRTDVNRYMDTGADPIEPSRHWFYAPIASINAGCRFKVAPQAHIDGDYIDGNGRPRLGNPCFKLIPEKEDLGHSDLFAAVYRLSKDDIKQDFSI